MGRPSRHPGGGRLTMTDETRKRGFRTTLSHVGRASKREHGFVNPPLLRGSTVLVPTVAERQALGARRAETGADLWPRRVGNALGAGGRDRGDRGGNSMLYRWHRTGGSDDSAARVAEGGRSS